MQKSYPETRFEAGTYMIAAAMAGDGVIIENMLLDHLKPLTDKLEEAGVQVVESKPGEVTDESSVSRQYLETFADVMEPAEKERTLQQERVLTLPLQVSKWKFFYLNERKITK